MAACGVELRPGSELGALRSGGLEGRHHFSFAAYQRSDRQQWGALRAVNIYRLEPGAIRAPTFHAGFEIVTIVVGGCLRRTGTFEPPQPLRMGAVELISTGTGANLGATAAGAEPASYLEIWVRSDAPARRARRQALVRCPTGSGQPIAVGPAAVRGALAWRAAGQLHRVALRPGETLDRDVKDGACIYIVVLEGKISGNDLHAATDDALAAFGPGRLSLRSKGPSELLIIETVRERPTG